MSRLHAIMAEHVLTIQKVSNASVYQALLGIHVTLQQALMNVQELFVYMVADVAGSETQAIVYALKNTMVTTVN